MQFFPKNLSFEIDISSFPGPDVFKWLQQTGKIDESEMLRAFNCGVGMVLAVKQDKMTDVLERLESHGETAWVIGQLKDA